MWDEIHEALLDRLRAEEQLDGLPSALLQLDRCSLASHTQGHRHTRSNRISYAKINNVPSYPIALLLSAPRSWLQVLMGVISQGGAWINGVLAVGKLMFAMITVASVHAIWHMDYRGCSVYATLVHGKVSLCIVSVTLTVGIMACCAMRMYMKRRHSSCQSQALIES